MNKPGEDLTLSIGPMVLPSRVDLLEELVARHGGWEHVPPDAQAWWHDHPPIAGGATPKWYVQGLVSVLKGLVDLDTDNIKLMLVTTSYTPAQTTDQYASAFSTNESTGGSGYPQYGFTLSSSTVLASGSVVSWDSPDVSQAITGGPFNFRYGCFYKYRGTGMASNEAIGYVDWGQQAVTDATITINLANQLTVTAS